VFHGVSFPLRFFPWVIIRRLPPGKDTPPFLSNTTFSYNSYFGYPYHFSPPQKSMLAIRP